jgi:hypothetical protein
MLATVLKQMWVGPRETTRFSWSMQPGELPPLSIQTAAIQETASIRYASGETVPIGIPLWASGLSFVFVPFLVLFKTRLRSDPHKHWRCEGRFFEVQCFSFCAYAGSHDLRQIVPGASAHRRQPIG